jgi:TatD DNase family protein
MFTDVHCHLNHEDFATDWQAAFQRAKAAGVGRLIVVGWDLASSKRAIEQAELNDSVWATVGVHPEDASGADENLERELLTLSGHRKVVAFGEIGLDYHYENSPRPVQQEVFRRQLAVAEEQGLPVMIHSREAANDTMEILSHFNVRCLLHCFGGSWETAKLALDRGYYFSFGGPVTFKNSKRAAEVVSKLPVERLMVETDSPYLAPVPNRGQRNEPAFLPYTMEKIAQLKGMPTCELAGRIEKNVTSFFEFLEQE